MSSLTRKKTKGFFSMSDPTREMADLFNGGAAGFFATFPMTAVMWGLHRYFPETRNRDLLPDRITGEIVQRLDIQELQQEQKIDALASISHFGYGIVSGALSAPLARRLPGSPLLSGMLVGLGVWLVSYLGWLPTAQILPPATEHSKERNITMISAHLVWGAAFGILLKRWGSRR